jgi:DNA-binding XRE family transcriptional regulator
MGQSQTVTIDRAEYERLLSLNEDLAGLKSALAIAAQIDRGEETAIPAAIAHRLIDGEPPLRVWREAKNLTQTALADLADVSRVQINDIEAGRAAGSIKTLTKLAGALGLRIDDIVPAH